MSPDLAQKERVILTGDVPSPSNPPKGCNFCTRCPQVMDICRQKDPEQQEVEPGRFVACHLFDTTITTAGKTAEPRPQEHNQQGEKT